MINRRQILKTLGAVTAVGLTLGNVAFAKGTKQPNVLFIAIDDLNDWVGCLDGHPQIETPSIDALAKSGVLFTNAHCASPLCNPSRAAVFSGRMPYNTKVQSNSDKLSGKVPTKTLMPYAFKAGGYRTYGTGKLLHKGTKGHWDSESFPHQRWTPFSSKKVDYTKEELPSKGTDNPRHVVELDGKEYILPLNRMPSDRNPNKTSGESFDWGKFDLDDSQMGDGKITDWAIARLNEHKKEHNQTPFFMAVGYYRPHIPLYAPSRYFEGYPEDKIILPPMKDDDLDDLPKTAREWVANAGTAGKHKTVLRYKQHKAAVAAYLACVTFVDAQVGRLLKALRETGNAENTIIVLWSDHGWHLGEKQHWGKWTGYERATRIPLIFAPGSAGLTANIKPNSRCSAPVSLVDMYPTLVDMCSLPTVKNLDGVSLASLLRNPSQASDRIVVTTFGKTGQENVSLRDKRYRYIHYADGAEELYDLQKDPNEWNNLARNPKMSGVIKRFKKNLPNY